MWRLQRVRNPVLDTQGTAATPCRQRDRKQTESLQCGSRRLGADFVAKVLAGLPGCQHSDNASNMIPRGVVVRNAIPAIAPNGTKILSVDGALDVMQSTDRLLQQNQK